MLQHFELSLEHCGFTDELVDALVVSLQGSPFLHTLKLGLPNNEVRSSGMLCLNETIHPLSVLSVDISNIPFQKGPMGTLGALNRLRSSSKPAIYGLTELTLNLRGCPVDPEEARSIGALASLKFLRKLSLLLGHTQIKDEGVHNLGELQA